MDDQDRSFRHETLLDVRALAEYLAALTEGFEKQSITFSDRGGEINLEPRGLVSFELDASRKSDKVRLTLRFSWKRNEPDGDAGPLVINGISDD